MKSFKFILVIAFVVFLYELTFAEGEKKNKNISKVQGFPSYTHFNINNISTWIKNDGESDVNANGNSGLVYPKGTGKTAVFQSGFVYGGKVNGEVRIGGSTYRQGQVPGCILPDGSQQNPADTNVRIWRVRRDFNDSLADFTSEILDGDGANAGEVYAKYLYDWNHWPVQYGAPYEDVDFNRQYDPNIDIPGYPNADQTIWFVANDLDDSQCLALYGCHSIGLEMQTTIWGYKNRSPLDNVMFRKYKLINRSSNSIDSMYFCMWSDPDVGDAGDDFVGCDTNLELGYAYNGVAIDGQYGSYPPAVGFTFLQGPIVDGSVNDTAIFDGKKFLGKKNLPMSAFFFFISPDPIYRDPTLGSPTGGLQFWNLLQGRISTTGQEFIIPGTTTPTKFCLSGDPVTHTGWVDGDLHPPGDRRIGLVAGPFLMNPGDTQEFVVAEILAGATSGTNNIQAIVQLKDTTTLVSNEYKSCFTTIISDIESSDIQLYSFQLSQNYPNPFNPSTVISYQLPVSSLVQIKIYNVLGQEIATLVNEEKLAGTHIVEFNASNLSSGIYFYRIETGKFVETKKMLLLK